MLKKVYPFLLIFAVIFSCRQEEKKDTFWESIATSNSYNPFVFVLSNTNIATCADHAQPKLEDIWDGKVSGISPNNVNAVMMFPGILDNQYSFIAEELKFLFDANGNNTLETWPAYFNDLTCFNIDSTEWHNSIKDDLGTTSKIRIGLDHAIDDGELKVYLRGIYTASSSNNSVAIYVYRKEESANHETLDGEELTTIKNRVIGAMTPTFGESISNGSSGKEIRETYTFSIGTETGSNLGVVAVIYNLEDSKPKSVVTSLRIDNL